MMIVEGFYGDGKGKHEAGRRKTRGGCTEERGSTGWQWCVNE